MLRMDLIQDSHNANAHADNLDDLISQNLISLLRAKLSVKVEPCIGGCTVG